MRMRWVSSGGDHRDSYPAEPAIVRRVGRVRKAGLEPARPKPLDPKSSASTKFRHFRGTEQDIGNREAGTGNPDQEAKRTPGRPQREKPPGGFDFRRLIRS